MQSFVLKLIDSILSTLKNILMIKGKGLLSSIVNGLATFSYMLIIVDMKNAILVSLATTIGQAFTFLITNKIEKDKVWVFDVSPKTKEIGKQLADKIREQNIPIKTYLAYNSNKQEILCSKIYSNSKAESRLIESFLNNDVTYSVHEIKEFNTI